MIKRSRNCFISYHHDNDEDYLKDLREIKGGMKFADYSLKRDIGHLEWDTIYKKIREKMRLCSVTIVLVGSRTGHREWIDWEIWASLRPYTHPTDPNKSFKPNGLLAVYLPVDWGHSVPKRLEDNIESGYAVEMNWEDVFNKKIFESKIREAHNKRKELDLIDNSRDRQEGNYISLFGFRI